MTRLARTLAVVLAAGAVVVPATAATAAAPEPGSGSLHGSGRVVFPPTPADEVWFSVDAHAIYAAADGGPFPSRSWGTMRVSHRFTDPEPADVWYTLTVDCLMTGGHTATVTGIVNAAAPGAENLIGQRIGFSVADLGRRDEVGFQVGAGECTAPATYFSVVEGGYQVRDGDHWPAPVTPPSARFGGL
ncbi:hypothetical protein [Actinoplanes sp. N902-109]|uniref:hypothetical protein n=1 Tax=Actinoplanes sp. (strain N902-109) TaxID=649831 RepID=UPI0003A57391|nr:hypothetical protein [Actinoplanes sp. N902-109]